MSQLDKKKIATHIDTSLGEEDTDQIAKSSIQDTKFVNNRLDSVVINTSSQEENVVNVVKALSNAPLPITDSLDKEAIIQEETTQRISLPFLTTSTINNNLFVYKNLTYFHFRKINVV